jgi:hypothetical protein
MCVGAAWEQPGSLRELSNERLRKVVTFNASYEIWKKGCDNYPIRVLPEL